METAFVSRYLCVVAVVKKKLLKKEEKKIEKLKTKQGDIGLTEAAPMVVAPVGSRELIASTFGGNISKGP
jgi:hypothetical protein